MKEIYRVKKGKVFSGDISIFFDFGLVFIDEGIYYLEFYVNENYNLNEHLKKEAKEDLFYKSFEMECFTEDNNKLSSFGLSTTQISPSKSKLCMTCLGALIFEDISLNALEVKNEIPQDERTPIYYIELEGLMMQFLDLTEIERYRGGQKLMEHFSKRDHTNTQIIYNGSTNSPSNFFDLTFSKNPKNELNIIVEFKGEYPNILYYDVFNEFKVDFIHLLSLLNGAEVRIRSEFIGKHYNINELKSQKYITYSFKPIINERHSQYIPINSPFHRTERIICKTFMNCFDKYIQWNKMLDLNTIIFYLNGAENANSVMEQLFTKMIAFERIATINYNLHSKTINSLVTPTQLDTIKNEVSPIMKKYSQCFNFDFVKVNSRLSNIFKETSSKTEDKLYFLLKTSNIEPDKNTKQLIDKIRHTIIHEGKLENLTDAVKYCFLVDKLLRDIILNLIGYDGSRDNRRNWFI